MLNKDELIESAAEHLYPRLHRTALTIHRFVDFDTEETLEVHRCPRKQIDSAALFWQLSVENRADFVPGDRAYRDHFLRDALCRPAQTKDVLRRYEQIRKRKKGEGFSFSLSAVGVLAEALTMVDAADEWCVLARTRREFVAVHWSTVARADGDEE